MNIKNLYSTSCYKFISATSGNKSLSTNMILLSQKSKKKTTFFFGRRPAAEKSKTFNLVREVGILFFSPKFCYCMEEKTICDKMV